MSGADSQLTYCGSSFEPTFLLQVSSGWAPMPWIATMLGRSGQLRFGMKRDDGRTRSRPDGRLSTLREGRKAPSVLSHLPSRSEPSKLSAPIFSESCLLNYHLQGLERESEN